MDIEDAVRNPSLANIGIAGLSTISDIFGYSFIRGLIKANKAIKASKAAYKAAQKTEEVAYNSYKNLKKAVTNVPTSTPKATLDYVRQAENVAKASHLESVENMAKAAEKAQRNIAEAFIEYSINNPFAVSTNIIDNSVNAFQQVTK